MYFSLRVIHEGVRKMWPAPPSAHLPGVIEGLAKCTIVRGAVDNCGCQKSCLHACRAVLGQHYGFQLSKMAMRVRASMTAVVYRKVSKVLILGKFIGDFSAESCLPTSCSSRNLGESGGWAVNFPKSDMHLSGTERHC